MSICSRCGVEYTILAAHNLICNGGILIFSDSSKYKKALSIFCMQHRIHYKEIHCPDSWVRDFFIQTPTKLYIRNKNGDHAGQRVFQNNKAVQPEPSSYAADRDHIYARMSNQIRRKINTGILPADHIKSTNRTLEGGNLFICENVRGKKYYIIGEYALEGDALMAFYKKKLDPDSSVNSVSELTIDRKKLKARYEKIFECRREGSVVLVLPNLTYHLDLYMAYIKRGTFLINSFRRGTYLGTDTTQINHLADKHKEAKKVVALLKRHGFKAELFDGVKYNTIAEQSTRFQIVGQQRGVECSLWNGSLAYSSLINGINLTSNVTGENFFVTLATNNEEHKKC